MNRILDKLSSRGIPSCDCRSSENCKTVPGLAYTPADMARLADRGMSITSTNESMFYDGDINPSFDVPLEMRRGTDANDAWNASCDARKQLLNAHRRDKAEYD